MVPLLNAGEIVSERKKKKKHARNLARDKSFNSNIEEADWRRRLRFSLFKEMKNYPFWHDYIGQFKSSSF
jgi:hypothetical protein